MKPYKAKPNLPRKKESHTDGLPGAVSLYFTMYVYAASDSSLYAIRKFPFALFLHSHAEKERE